MSLQVILSDNDTRLVSLSDKITVIGALRVLEAGSGRLLVCHDMDRTCARNLYIYGAYQESSVTFAPIHVLSSSELPEDSGWQPVRSASKPEQKYTCAYSILLIEVALVGGEYTLSACGRHCVWLLGRVAFGDKLGYHFNNFCFQPHNWIHPKQEYNHLVYAIPAQTAPLTQCQHSQLLAVA